MMKYKTILLTGSSGKLGQAIVKSGHFQNILAPNREVLDITKPETIEKFFRGNDIEAVIHCAALARMKECEEDTVNALKTNIIGTGNLVMETIRKEKEKNEKIRFIHISTDAVYNGTKGSYSEKDAAIPYNKYGWTKLGAECAVNMLSNFCIIRTSFFDPENIRFEESADDAYSSKVKIGYLANAITIMLNHKFVGTINIGSKRTSDYERYSEFKPSLKKSKFEKISKAAGIPVAKDASMDFRLWEQIEKEENDKKTKEE